MITHRYKPDYRYIISWWHLLLNLFCACSVVGDKKRLSTFAADHSDVTVGQPSQRDVTASRSRHRRVSVETTRLPGSAHHAVAALLPARQTGNGRGHFRRRDGFSPVQDQVGVELLRVGHSARARGADDGGGIPVQRRGIPQYNHMRRPEPRTERAVYVQH